MTTLLSISPANEDFKKTKLLLEAGSNCNAANKNGLTPLHCAAYLGCPEIAELLLDQQGIMVDKTDKKSNTPLHFTAEKDDHVAALNLMVKESWSPFISRDIMLRNDEIIHCLLHPGANSYLKNNAGRSVWNLTPQEQHAAFGQSVLAHHKVFFRQAKASAAANASDLASPEPLEKRFRP